MRVLHVNEIAQFTGGVERIMYDTARGLTAQGLEQALLVERGDIDLRMEQVFVSVFRQFESIESFAPDVVFVHKASMGLVEQLSKRYRTVRFVHDHDVVCLRRHKYFPVSTQVCDKAAGTACITHGCVVQRSVQSVIPITLGSLKRQRAEIAVNQKLDGLIVASEWMRQSLLENGFAEDKLQVIPPVPASLDGLQPLGQQDAVPTILFVGQIIRGKGVDLLLRALAELKGEWRAVIVGEGNYRIKAERLAEKLNLIARVEFTGQLEHEDLNALYSQARCTVVPSRWPEPFGMVGLEAMARAKAVVGFAVGGIPDWLENEKTGLLAAPQDVVGLSIALQKLLDRPEYAEQLGRVGRERVEERYSHRHYLDAVKKFLEQVSESSHINVCR